MGDWTPVERTVFLQCFTFGFRRFFFPLYAERDPRRTGNVTLKLEEKNNLHGFSRPGIAMQKENDFYKAYKEGLETITNRIA